MKYISIDYTPNPSSIFLKLSLLDGLVWLDSGRPLCSLGRYDILSALPSQVVEGTNKTVVDTLNARLSHTSESLDLPFCGGWIGCLSYSGMFKFGWYDWAIIVDHQTRTSRVIYMDSCSKNTEKAIQEALILKEPTQSEYCCSRFQSDLPTETYLKTITTIQDHLKAGDCYQVNFAQRFSSHFKGSTSSAYLTLRQAVPSPFSAYMKTDEGAILSISPERFIQINGRNALTQPIKGTIARENNSELDQKQKAYLQHSAKDLAENVMIVDLLRNDFNRHCIPFSVKVPKLFEIQSFSNVHHLVSTIVGTLTKKISHIEFILSCFPGGSITGAPKKRAMEIIGVLEPHSRDIYCGSIGYLSSNGRSDFNIAIRTLKVEHNTIYSWAGGGIVLDSDPKLEYAESLSKIEKLLRSIETKH